MMIESHFFRQIIDIVPFSLIGIIACYNGITATGGADGVGRATTNTVVVSSLSVIISDFFLTKLFLLF